MTVLLGALMLLLPMAADAEPLVAQRASAARVQTALEKQKASIARQQPGGSGFFTSGWSLPVDRLPVALMRHPPRGACGPLPEEEIADITARAAVQHGVSADVIRAVVARESGGRPCVVSPKGAQGLMQLMPATQTDLGVTDPFDPVQNVTAGAAYLRQMLDRYRQDLRLALAAFNAGPARVDESGGVPRIEETQEYVRGILSQLGAGQE